MIEQRVRSIVGSNGEMVVDSTGRVEVAPRSEDECALLLAAAYREGWSVRVSGAGSWMVLGSVVDLTVSTKCLVGVCEISPADMVLTAKAGTSLKHLQAIAANEGTWIALDPPGSHRSLGSILATSSAGPLRTGFGAVRSRILGLTFATADGRVVRVGGRVVKNVAGFDLRSLLVGSFGAFGMITSAHVRLNALPVSDVTLIGHGPRDNLLLFSRDILSTGTTPAAMELIAHECGDKNAWMLAVRLLGSDAAVDVDRHNIAAAAASLEFDTFDGETADQLWASSLSVVSRGSTTIRIGCLQTELGAALDLMTSALGSETGVSASILPGVARCGCDATTEQIQEFRAKAADREWPVTVERAPWEVLEVVGHYGAYRGGVGRLISSLRGALDERGVLVVPLGGNPD